MKVCKIREAYGEWALDIEMPERIQVIYFASRQNALQVMHYLQLVDNIIKLDEKKLQTPMTNYDNIKAMSVEELADVLYDANDKICFENCSASTGNKFSCPLGDNLNISDCKKCIKKWLESEVSE